MTPLTQVELLGHLADAFPHECAWRNLADGRALTLLEWHTESNRLARGFAEHGLVPGQRVALAVGDDDPLEWLVSYMAIHKAGGVAVPLNTRLSWPELERIVRHADPRILLAGSGVLTRHPAIAESAPLVGLVEQVGLGSWSALRAADPSDVEHRIDSDDVADIMYTSGTTGVPKAVVIRHGGLATIDRVPAAWLGLGFLSSSPFSTTSGSLLVCGPARGGLTGLFLPTFDVAPWLAAVSSARPVAAFLVPAMVQLIAAHLLSAQTDLSSLAVVNIGSAPIAAETLQRFGQLVSSAEVLCGYGMTEFGAVSTMPMGDRGRHLGSVGKPLPGVAVRILNEEGRPLPVGGVGEIAIRGDRSPRTYFHPESDSEASPWQEGWLRSGDLGSFDADGFLWISGRKKEMIIRGGHNVMPGEVEAALFRFPAVVDAAVVGIPHAVLGEDVAAWVVLDQQADNTLEALRRFLQTEIADYKVPRRITVVDALPRNDAGKVLKARLTVDPEETTDHD